MTAYIIVLAACAIVGAIVVYITRRYEFDNTIESCDTAIRMIRLYEALNCAAEYEGAPMQEPSIIDTPNLAEGDGRNETQITR